MTLKARVPSLKSKAFLDIYNIFREGRVIVFDIYIYICIHVRVCNLRAESARKGSALGGGYIYIYIYARRMGLKKEVCHIRIYKWKNNDSDKAKPCLVRDGFSFIWRRDERWTSDRAFPRRINIVVYRPRKGRRRDFVCAPIGKTERRPVYIAV